MKRAALMLAGTIAVLMSFACSEVPPPDRVIEARVTLRNNLPRESSPALTTVRLPSSISGNFVVMESALRADQPGEGRFVSNREGDLQFRVSTDSWPAGKTRTFRFAIPFSRNQQNEISTDEASELAVLRDMCESEVVETVVRLPAVTESVNEERDDQSITLKPACFSDQPDALKAMLDVMRTHDIPISVVTGWIADSDSVRPQIFGWLEADAGSGWRALALPDGVEGVVAYRWPPFSFSPMESLKQQLVDSPVLDVVIEIEIVR